MKKTIHIKPAVLKQKGLPDKPLQVRMPDKPHTFMPAHGAAVVYNTHWHRRIQDGSVVKITAEEFAKGEAAAAAAAKKAATAKAQADQVGQ